LLDVVKISKFTYSILAVIAFFGLAVGTSMYNKFFKDTEYRRMIVIDALISILFAPPYFIFVLRWNLDWGIPDLPLIIFSDIVDEVIS